MSGAQSTAPNPNGRTGVYVIAALVIVGAVGLRLRAMPRVDPGDISAIYSMSCANLQADRDFTNAYAGTRELVRTPGAPAEAHFLYQFVRLMDGAPETAPALRAIEAPLPALLRAEDFDGARELIRELVATSPAMSEARGRLWNDAITSLELRFDYGCEAAN